MDKLPDKVLDFARNIIEHGFPPGVLGIDAKWQDEFGSTRFDPSKFPDPAATVATLHEMGMQVTLWTVPFFNRGSEHYEAVADFAIKKPVGGNQYFNTSPTAELLIRWTQAVAPMPIVQFSVPPWEFGKECAEICARYARLHRDLAALSHEAAAQRAPIIRPLWWIAPDDEAALVCSDSYLVGESLLVAPVLREGQRQRDVYLPPGQWRNYWDHHETAVGGRWLLDAPCPIDKLLLYVRTDM